MRTAEQDKNSLNVLIVWAIGLSGAFSGQLFGWQLSLSHGFEMTLITMSLISLFFWIFSAALCDLSARYKSDGGAYDFVQTALGIREATIMAIMNVTKLILSNASTALLIVSLCMQNGMHPHYIAGLIFSLYLTATFLDCVCVTKYSTSLLIGILICSCILVFSCGGSIANFHNYTIESYEHKNNFISFMQALPFAIKFYDGFQDIPLLTCYSNHNLKVIPKSISRAYITLLLLGFSILVIVSGSYQSVSTSDSEYVMLPLLQSIRTVFGLNSKLSSFISQLFVLILCFNFLTLTIFTSQQIRAISESGQLPYILAYKHPNNGSPIIASITSSIAGLIITYIAWKTSGLNSSILIFLSATLLTSIISYILILQSNIKILKLEHAFVNTRQSISRDSIRMGYNPDHLRFNFGIYGARFCQLLCVFFLIGLFMKASLYETNELLIGLSLIICSTPLLYMAILKFTPPEANFDQHGLNGSDGATYSLITGESRMVNLDDYDSIYPSRDDL
eukprot:gene4181-5949_t